MSKIKNSLLSLNNLRKAFGNSLVFEAVKSDLKLEIIHKFEAKNILILSPHPDDDVFGCGGTIALAKESGAKITTLYLTNGHNYQRVEEAKKAAFKIGVDDVFFWKFANGKLEANDETIDMLDDIVRTTKPDIIFTPNFSDPHHDHTETTRLLAQYLADDEMAKFIDCSVWQYEIWQPVYANRLVVIDQKIDLKKEAILLHKSQLKDRHYLEATLGLNQYRAGMYDADTFAEGFFAANKKLFLKQSQIFI
ncbi:MAG: PIG-L family deacetylase [Candidatus Berkelbacteria bacterium]|nr:PIG-L family deacetylase [Candidatus Berkelbacteria bacterium]